MCSPAHTSDASATVQVAAHQPAPVHEQRAFELGQIFHICSDRLYFAVHASDEFTARAIEEVPTVFFFSSSIPESYASFCKDFGPVDISMVVHFCLDVRSKIQHPRLAGRPVVYYVGDPHPHTVTNSVFLLCAYLVLVEGFSPEQAVARFTRILNLPVVPFRDASSETPSFHLAIIDILRGVQKAVGHGWFKAADAPAQRTTGDAVLSKDFSFNTHLHEALYERRTHDITRVTPKFCSFATPKAVGDKDTGPRPVSVHVGPLKASGVTDVVRLCESMYDAADFEKAGISHHVLEFTDCTCPSRETLKAFLDICDEAKGGVAVHCLAGLGRTGTLIGAYLIKNQGFTANEAIGYLRLMRPGSVLGEQQQFLKIIETVTWDGNMPLLRSKRDRAGTPPRRQISLGWRKGSLRCADTSVGHQSPVVRSTGSRLQNRVDQEFFFSPCSRA